MLKKFSEGLVFGGGFAISFITIWYIAAYLVFPMFVASRIEQETNTHLSELGADMQPSGRRTTQGVRQPVTPFHELGLEDQIKKSSVIALAKYERAPDGKMRAIIKEFLKKDPTVTIYYNIGDEYPSASYYPKDKMDYGDGLVLFFTGSPAMMKMSVTYSGDHIRGLGDLPVELLRKECKEPNA